MKIICFLIFFKIFIQQIQAQTPWSERMANAMLETHKDSITYKEEGKFARWDYEQAILLKALERVWTRTGDGKYYQFILKNMDSYVNEKGEIKTYKGEQFNIDNITGGRILLMLYRETGKEKFKLAADLLRNQLKNQPRTQEGGFWHKKIYPNQMWLDGLYMAEPFYAQYSKAFDESQNFDDIANQFIWMENTPETLKQGFCIMVGMKVKNKNGQIKPLEHRQTSGIEPWAGT